LLVFIAKWRSWNDTLPDPPPPPLAPVPVLLAPQLNESISISPVADAGAIGELGQALRAAGLNGEGVRQALRSAGDLGAGTADVEVHKRRLAGDEVLANVVRLFVLELPVSDEAIAPIDASELERLGLVARSGDKLHPLVRVVPHDETLIASDLRLRPGTESRADHVAGVQGPVAHTLAPDRPPAGRLGSRYRDRLRDPDHPERAIQRPGCRHRPQPRRTCSHPSPRTSTATAA
jgi:hypothetical protein